MNKNRKGKFLVRTYMGGRLPKLPDENGGATGDSNGAANNQGVNSGESTVEGGNQNNNGQSFDPDGFWKNPEEPGSDNSNQQQQQENQEEDIGKVLVSEIGQYNPGLLFTAENMQEMADGKLESVNKAFQTMSQNILRQSVIQSAKIMRAFEQAIDDRISNHVQSNQQQVGDEALLQKNFPSFAKPAAQPMIRGVFNQSLKHSKGDRTKAVEMAKDFLRSMGQLGGEDFGFTPPRNPDDNYMGDNSKSLIDDLLSMKG